MDREVWDRPFISHAEMALFEATDAEEARAFGLIAKAAPLSNVEYKIRFGRLSAAHRMKSPPSCGRIFLGQVVVRRLGLPEQYETWMPEHVFNEIYRPAMDG